MSSTQRMAESLVEAQSVALKSQETIIRNGEELKHTLHHSTQGSRRLSPCSVDKVMLMANLLENSPSRKFMSPLHLSSGIRAVFDEMRLSAQEQQVAFSEIFNRVAFLQSFIMSESHTFTSLLYNSLGFLAAFFLTATQRTAPARCPLCLYHPSNYT